MTNFSVTPLSSIGADQENRTMNNNGTLNTCIIWYSTADIKLVVIFFFSCVACLVGLLGNGTVIWLLGFRMKRTHFTTYILNLAVADFGVLILVILLSAPLFLKSDGRCLPSSSFIGWMLFHFMFSISQCLLTIISIDRCVSVLFPVWYRCHRSEKLSTILCALVWIFGFLVHGICDILTIYRGFLKNGMLFYLFLVNAVVCLPLVTVSTTILFIRLCVKSRQHRWKKPFLAILLALFFFLFLAFPFNVLHLMMFNSLHSQPGHYLININNISAGYLNAYLNSCVNPIIYFLVGRKKKDLCTENVRLIFQRVFSQEEEVYGEELQSSAQTQIPE